MSLILDVNCTSNKTFLDSVKIVPVVVVSLCCLVGLPSNIMVIICIARAWKTNLSFTIKLMLNLAVSDALTLSLAPFVLFGLCFGWKLGLWSCKIVFFLIQWSLYVGVLTVSLMSVHRYHSIIKYRVTNRMILHRLEHHHGLFHLTSIWILSLAFSLPVLFIQRLTKKNGLQRCERMMKSEAVVAALSLFEIFSGFAIPLIIMLTAYLCLHRGLSKKIRVCKAELKLRDGATLSKTYKKRLVISIVVSFVLFWTPVQLFNVINMVRNLGETSHHGVYLQLNSFHQSYGDAVKSLALLNCSLNPFLYGFFSRNIFKSTR